MKKDSLIKPIQKLSSIATGLETLLQLAGKQLIVGTPLGVGKPNALLNALWQRAREDDSLQLSIFTALSLALPRPKSLLEKRFLLPFVERHFGEGYPDLEYIQDVLNDTAPANAQVAEFYMQSGAFLGKPAAQRNYTSSNYTHAARDMADRGVNVIVQLVGLEQREGELCYSLGSNPDTTQDLLDIIARRGHKRPVVVAVVNRNMPFMTGKAERHADFFDLIIDDPDSQHQLFAPPIAAVNLVDHSIGLHAGTLIADGGTLQIGIGSLGDALVSGLKLRHTDTDAYQSLIKNCGISQRHKWLNTTELTVFKQGLYAASEMFMDGFMHLYKAGILKRKVWPDADIQNLINTRGLEPVVSSELFEALCESNALPPILDQHQLERLQTLGIVADDIVTEGDAWVTASGRKLGTDMRQAQQRADIIEHALLKGAELKGAAILHSAFFMGSKPFYTWLHSLKGGERDLFQMTTVSQVNELYGGEELDRAQRLKSRFVNTTMKVTLLGAAASDGLDNNQVVSGVGGQYNFVAMAHALPDSRSILMVRSTHGSGKTIQSNIAWTYPYDTIPRHLRDVVITEYGIALLRGKSDEDCIKAMLCVADSRFQSELMQTAKQHGKLATDWQIPEIFQQNTPADLCSRYAQARSNGQIPQWPFGSDFTEVELRLVKALGWLKQATKTRTGQIKTVIQSFFGMPAKAEYSEHLQRMDFLEVTSFEEKMNRRLLLLALTKTT
ncbi:MAG: acetyl-CoA hydrolase [Xanthomonadales bacterium]|nr:acetyl-CoA hydrolase [Xanthomonadales bacterium]